MRNTTIELSYFNFFGRYLVIIEITGVLVMVHNSAPFESHARVSFRSRWRLLRSLWLSESMCIWKQLWNGTDTDLPTFYDDFRCRETFFVSDARVCQNKRLLLWQNTDLVMLILYCRRRNPRKNYRFIFRPK